MWRPAWCQQQLLNTPTDLFAARGFYPFKRTYRFDELILGAAIVTLPVRLVTGNPVTDYNVAVLSSFVLGALALYALALRLGVGRTAAFAAGLVYAFAPLHLAHIFHLGLLSGQWFPLVILFLDRLFTTPRWRDALLLALAMVMQARSAQYYAIYLVLVVALFVGVYAARGLAQRHFPPAAVWIRSLGAAALAVAAVAPFAVAYRAVQSQFGFARAFHENAFFSARLRGFFTADAQNLLWDTSVADGANLAPTRRSAISSRARSLSHRRPPVYSLPGAAHSPGTWPRWARSRQCPRSGRDCRFTACSTTTSRASMACGFRPASASSSA